MEKDEYREHMDANFRDTTSHDIQMMDEMQLDFYIARQNASNNAYANKLHKERTKEIVPYTPWYSITLQGVMEATGLMLIGASMVVMLMGLAIPFNDESVKALATPMNIDYDYEDDFNDEVFELPNGETLSNLTDWCIEPDMLGNMIRFYARNIDKLTNIIVSYELSNTNTYNGIRVFDVNPILDMGAHVVLRSVGPSLMPGIGQMCYGHWNEGVYNSTYMMAR